MTDKSVWILSFKAASVYLLAYSLDTKAADVQPRCQSVLSPPSQIKAIFDPSSWNFVLACVGQKGSSFKIKRNLSPVRFASS